MSAALPAEARQDGSGCCQLPKASPAPDLVEAVGRRIYIHEQALAHLASRGRQAAEMVFSTVARIAVIKAIHHQVSQDGVMLGLISEEKAAEILEAFESEWSDVATACLRGMGSANPNEDREIAPLLRDDESVVATCYFSNYYTFATGQEMAEKMYRDESSVAEIRQQMLSGTDYQDLSLISGGKGLLPILPEAEPGRKNLSDPELARIRMEVLRDLRMNTREILRSRAHLTPAEISFVEGRIDQSLGVVFSRGILKTL